MKKILPLLLLITCLSNHVFGQVETKLISAAVVPGERTIVSVFITNGERLSIEDPPRIEGASIRYIGSGYTSYSGAKNHSAAHFDFEVTADKPGSVTIPSFTLRSANGDVYQTREETLTVYPFSAINWQKMPLQNTDVNYGVLWHIPNKTPFINQPVYCEVKIYAHQQVIQYGSPNMQNNGVAADNFRPAFEMAGFRPLGMALIQGREWKVMTFQSHFTPLRAGAISLSGTVPGVLVFGTHDPVIAMFNNNTTDIPFTLPEVSLEARDFPPGAPAGFTNAVGRFRIKTETFAPDLSANEPILVDITVEGSGNLGALECPEITDPGQWKLYPATRLGDPVMDGDIGRIRFQQSMRPIQEVSAIPPFTLSFFDPETERFHTVSSAPIPLPWKQAQTSVMPTGTAEATPPPAGIVPVEQMTDIYGLVPAEAISSLSLRTSWKWYLLSFIPFLGIAAAGTTRFVRKRRQRSAASRERMEAFRQIDTTGSASEFLRSVGAFIETRIPPEAVDPPLREILDQRDSQAFLPESAVAKLPQNRRSAMLASIKKSLSKLPVFMLTLLLAGMTCIGAGESAGEKAYRSGEFSKAKEEFSVPATTARDQAAAYYNLGNSLYRLNKPGEAALAYHRALTIAPHFTEAQRNLGFIERKEGAILAPQSQSRDWLALLPHSCLAPLILVSSALFLTCLALWIYCRRYTVLLSLGTVLFLLIAGTAGANLAFYPVLPSSIDPDRLAIVTNEVQARTAADKDSPALMTIPPSTPLILVATRGSWSYVRTFSGTPAWIETSRAQVVGNPRFR